MARSSLVHYIIPSAISITPNCNSSVSDLAVYVARGTKIKVNSKKAGIDTAGGSYQEWVLTGRNRRLADSTVPYTIYARLRKTDKTDGYLMFVPQQQVSGQWKDKYPYVTTDGLYRDVYGQESSVYYYIRLGDVTLPGADGREVILDTGILGTEQYNEEWNLNPDNLPVRVDIGCTIDDEDAGPTPYVYFGKTLVLTASLQEGWSDTDVERFDHWEIARNTGDATADAAWPSQERQAQFAESGTIDLVHTRDDDDDFNGAVSGIFTVTAWGIEDDFSGTPAPVVIATASISIMAETVEKYDLQLSANIVSYSPQTGAYTPADGVKVAIRATDQRGDVFNMTNAQVQSGRLSADYAPVDSSDWTPLVFSGGAAEEAQATIPISAFASEQGLKVRLLRTIDASTGTVMEMTGATIAFVRDGEDSKEREWIFQHTLTVTTYGDEHSEHPRPSVIDGGEVKPSGVAGGDDHNKDQDGWVPQGWCDNPQGIDETYQFEYGSYRDFIHSDSSGSSSGRGGHWGEFTEPRIWNHYAGDAVTYDIVPSVSVINADAAGTVTSDGIIVRAYQTKGSERSENILPSSDYPESGDYYFAEYSVDGGEWTRCEAFDYPAAGGTVIPVYGIPADAVRTATEGITLRLKHSSDTTFVLKENTPIKVLRVISEDEVSDMVQELGREEFLSRLYDDFASGEIGFLKGLWVKAKNLYGISEDGDARLHDTDISGTAHVGEDLNIDGELHGISAVLNKIVSSEYTGDGMLDTGFLLQYAQGRAKLVVDDLVARGKFTVNELETRIWTYAGGNMIFSGAGSTVFFVEYLDASENILGYTSINAPWLLNGRPLLSAMVAWSKRRWVQRSLTDEEKASVVKFRCYEYSDDGTMQTRNWWHVNDLALCQTLNKVKDKVNSDGSYSGYASNTVYHRRVAGIGSKKIAAMGDDRVYDYVDLWNIYDVQGQTYIDAQGQERTITDDVKGFLNMAPTGQAPSTDWPAAGDVIVQVGNPLDRDRQGAVTIEVQGDTHGLKVYDTISGYSMENKLWVEIGYDQTTGKAKANVYGDFRFGCRASEEQGGGSYVKYNRTTGKLDIRANVHFTSPTTHTPTTLDNFASAVVGDLENLQSQIDGQIESWFYNYSPVATDSQGVPTSNVPLNVAPYSEWTTDALKIAHLNDTFTNNNTGYCWRFSRNATTNAFEWVIIEDSAVIKALQDAAKAQDTADHKRRVFMCDADNQTPVPPYDPGDLWVNVKYPWATGATYNNEILKCDKAVPRTEGGQEITGFNINDWSLSNGYTSKLNTFVNNTYAPFVQDISQQVDKKAETFRQATDPADSWTDAQKPEHVGDLWMDISANGGKKTYIYVDKGACADPRYVWEEQDVPDEVFDEIDGKAEIFVQKPTEYMERDLWIIESGLAADDMPAGCQAGDIVVADNMPQGTTKRTSYTKGDWRKKDRYTDDTKANEVALGLAKEITDRGKAVSDAQAAAAQDATNKVNTAKEELEDAIDAVDEAHSTAEGALEDGYIDNDEREALKAVLKSLDAEFTDVTASYSVVYNNSLLNGTTQKTDLYNAYTALVSAHDAYDAAFTSFIDAPATTKYEKGDSEGDYTYTPEGAQEAITVNLTTLQTTFDTCASTYQTALESANAKIQDEIKKIADAAVSEITSYRYIANAIDASTVIQGGLMLTSAIFLRQLKEDGDPKKESDYTTWAGINGTTPDGDSSIAAWYGGDMEDKQAAGTPDPTVRYAKSLFRMDGSGYLAGGNISWDNSGNATFKGTISTGTTITDYEYLQTALGGDTNGLVLANQIALKNGNTVMAGMSGAYSSSSPGGGIAAWYGGTKNDREHAAQGADVSSYAKALFRMDGSGYLAKGNISWDNSGNATFKGTISTGTTITDYEYLQTALGGDTSGLVLANQIALKNGSAIMAGMSGVYNAEAAGGGIAAWYGGTKNDRENAPEGTDVSGYAKALFRMDGTGYMAAGKISWNADGSGKVAGGNISWNADGDVTIQGTVVNATTKIDTPAIFLNGTDITATLNAVLDMFEKDTTTQPGTTLIKAKYSLYSVGDVSALGASGGGGGGGGGGASVLYELNDVLANSGNTGVLDAQAGYVLTCVNSSGVLKWKAAPTSPIYSAGYGLTLGSNTFTLGHRWTAYTQGLKWSRIMYGETKTATVGCNGILTLRSTRANVVRNITFLITTSHSSYGQIVPLSSNNYAAVRMRILVNSTGNFYIEIYDSEHSIASGTTQNWYCTFVPLSDIAVTTYSVFTDGTSVPSGYTAQNDFTTSVGDEAVAIKSISRNGTTFTATRQNGSTFTFTQQDTTYSAGNGLVLNNNQFSIASKVLVQGSVIDTHHEGSDTIILDGVNELMAFYDRDGVCDAYEVEQSATLTNQTLTRTSTAVAAISANVFNGLMGYNQGTPYTGEKFAVYDLALPATFAYSTSFFWSFGNSTWKPAKIRILVGSYKASGFTYTQKYSSDECPAFGKVDVSSGSTGFNRLRIVVSNYRRLSCLGIVNYSTTGFNTTLMSRCIDNWILRNITPAKDNTWALGTSTNRWKEVRAVKFYGALEGNADSATNADNADKLDDQEAIKFGWVYNSSEIGNSSSVTVNDLASAGGSNATFGMICSGTDNPTGAGKWVHVWSQQWTINTASSWVSQIAIGTQDKNGMWYRCTNSGGTIVGVAWKRVLDSSNSSVSKSGSTLTVKINGTEQSLENTWRGIQDNLTSDSTSDSLSAKQGKALANGSARDNTKLPLSGDTMTGVLTLKGSQYAGYKTGSSRTYAMNANNSDIVGINALIMADKSDGWTESIGFPRDGSDAGHYDTFRAANGTFYFGFNGYFDSSNVEHAASELITMSGSTVKLERSDANNAEMTVKNSNGAVSLLTSTNRGLYNSTGSNWIIATNGTNTWMSVGKVGIGTDSPSYKLHVSGSGYFSGHTYFNDWIDVTQGVAARCIELDPPTGTSDGGYIDFHYGGSSADYTSRLIESSSGVVSLYGSFYATGDVTAASDQRDKDFVEDVVLSLEQIANAPAVKFKWKDKRDELVHIGTYAQYWQDVLPESVSNMDDKLGFAYSNTAYTAVVNLAREVKRLRERIVELENKQIKSV